MESHDLQTAGQRQFVDPRVEYIGQVHGQGLVRPKRWEHFCREAGIPNRLVAREVVSGIVSGTERTHLKLSEDPVRTQIVRCERRAGAIPDARGGRLVEQLIDPEVALQLEMRP